MSDTPIRLEAEALRDLVVGQRPAVVDTKRIAYGTGGDGDPPPPTDLARRETQSFTWGREVYHDFVELVQNAPLDGQIAATQLREYIMRMLVAYSGHPDSKTAMKALELLGKVRNVGLFEDKARAGTTNPADAAQVMARLAELTKEFNK